MPLYRGGGVRFSPSSELVTLAPVTGCGSLVLFGAVGRRNTLVFLLGTMLITVSNRTARRLAVWNNSSPWAFAVRRF
jgi:hypothetical protein